MSVGAGESPFVVANDDFPKAVMVEKRYKSFKPYWAVVIKSIDRGMFVAKIVSNYVGKIRIVFRQGFRTTVKKEYW